MSKKYIITLTEAEQAELRKRISMGKGAARRLSHARILLKADQGLTDERIAAEVEVGTAEDVLDVYTRPLRSQATPGLPGRDAQATHR
jgi:hypothetical protein